MRGHFLRAAAGRRVSGGGEDADAAAYLDAVEAADGQALEAGVRAAVNDFVVGCKADGIWDAIEASCILAGARTLDGALVPLVGPAPTNVGFDDGDYDRKNGITKTVEDIFIDSNYSVPGANINNHHAVIWGSAGDGDAWLFGQGATVNAISGVSSGYLRSASSSSTNGISPGTFADAMIGVARSDGAEFSLIYGSSIEVRSTPSTGLIAGNMTFFSRGGADNANLNQVISFYSVGTSLSLALIDARVSILILDLAAAIP